MGRPANITLTATRARARQIHPRVLILNAMLFTVAGTVTIALFTAAVCLVNGWGLLPGIVMGAAGAAAAGGLWLFSTLAWVLHVGLSGVQRMSRGWMTAVVILALVGAAAVSPWWIALAAMAVGLAATPVLSKLARRVEGTKMTSWNLPQPLMPVLRSLPERLPPQVDTIVDMAFRDWIHLRDLIGFTSQSALRAYVDMGALSRDAERTALYLMRRAPVVAKLVDLANERGEKVAIRAAETAVQRLRRVGEVLHEAVTAASQFAASEEREEAHELKIRVDGLKELASSLELDGLEIESHPEYFDDPYRFRVSEIMPDPAPAAKTAAPAGPVRVEASVPTPVRVSATPPPAVVDSEVVEVPEDRSRDDGAKA